MSAQVCKVVGVDRCGHGRVHSTWAGWRDLFGGTTWVLAALFPRNTEGDATGPKAPSGPPWVHSWLFRCSEWRWVLPSGVSTVP